MNMIEKVQLAIEIEILHGNGPYQQAKAAIAAMRDLVKCCPDGNMADDRIVNEYIDAALKE